MLPDLNAGAATSTAGTRTRFGFAAESLPFTETVHPTITKQIVEYGEIPTSRATCRPTTNSLPEGFRAYALLDHLVEELWSSAVAKITRTAYKAGFQCLLTFLTLSGVVSQLLELPELSEDVLILLCNILSFIFKVWCTIKLYLAGIKGFNIYKLFGQLIDFSVSSEQLNEHNCLVQRIYCQLI